MKTVTTQSARVLDSNAEFYRKLYSDDTLRKISTPTTEPSSTTAFIVDETTTPADVYAAAQALLLLLGAKEGRWHTIQMAACLENGGVHVKAVVIEPAHSLTAQTLARL